MIEIGYSQALFIVLLLAIAWLLLLHRRECRRVRRDSWTMSHGEYLECGNCHHSFLLEEDAKDVDCVTCPNCHAEVFTSNLRRLQK